MKEKSNMFLRTKKIGFLAKEKSDLFLWVKKGKIFFEKRTLFKKYIYATCTKHTNRTIYDPILFKIYCV